jgi:hypothetical protein
MKILCDQMLGTLTKWLRILGFDVFNANTKLTDEELLEIAKNENRIIISRDKRLILSGKKSNLNVIEIKSTNLNQQLKQVLEHLHINEKEILSRCTICNTKLESIQKREVEGKVPERVFENKNDFWFCQKCNKLYWMGTHYENMLHRISELMNK